MLLTLLLAAPGWTVMPLEIPNLAEYEGRYLAGVKVVDFAQSEIVDRTQVTELRLQGSAPWQVHCLKRQQGRRFDLVCRLDAPGQPSLRMSLASTEPAATLSPDGTQWVGVAGGAERLTITGTSRPIDDDMDGHRLAGARFVDTAGHPVVEWYYDPPFKLMPRMRVPEGLPTERLERLAALMLTFDIVGDRWSTAGAPVVYDGYRIKPGKAPRQWDTLRPNHGALVDDPGLLASGPRLDRSAGVLIEREGHGGRIVMGIEAGGVTAPTASAGEVGGLEQFSIDINAGARLGQRTQLAVTMGLQAGTLEVPDAHLSLGGFGLGLHARHAFSLGVIEPVIGARVRGRLRFGEVTGEDGTLGGSATQWGVGLAPTVGVQWPWTLNRYDTRLVVFLEAAPEWSFWTAADGEEMPPELARTLQSEMRTRDWAMTTAIGIRFEL